MCVIGGGAAGITIANEIANHSVIVLESGGLEFDPKIQKLYQGENPRDDFSLETSRFRMLGGTTYAWGGWCSPLDAIDFQRRDWVTDSGWPITKQDLVPYYQRAQNASLGATVTTSPIGACSQRRHWHSIPPNSSTGCGS